MLLVQALERVLALALVLGEAQPQVALWLPGLLGQPLLEFLVPLEQARAQQPLALRAQQPLASRAQQPLALQAQQPAFQVRQPLRQARYLAQQPGRRGQAARSEPWRLPMSDA